MSSPKYEHYEINFFQAWGIYNLGLVQKLKDIIPNWNKTLLELQKKINKYFLLIRARRPPQVLTPRRPVEGPDFHYQILAEQTSSC